MEASTNLESYSCRESFKQITNCKGVLAPIAEKSCRNFETKTKNPVNVSQRLHYFAIGHAFKQLDTEQLFRLEFSEEQKKKVPTRYCALTKKQFPAEERLKTVLGNIRNINSHYAHDFSQLRLDVVGNDISQLLRESFEVAALMVYLDLNGLTLQQHEANPIGEGLLVGFLCERFFPLSDEAKRNPIEENAALSEYIKVREQFRRLPLLDAIEELLFVEVKEGFEWPPYGEHRLLTVERGRYLSFNACLFLLTMFLYRSEANQLISKVKGFKRNDDDEFRSKRNIFAFFAKKFTSQDVNSEENDLIKFRDMVQYLNKYPTCWNGALEEPEKYPEMVETLHEAVIEKEIKRAYPLHDDDGRVKDELRSIDYDTFVGYARYHLWGIGDISSITTEDRRRFTYAMEAHPELINARKTLRDLQYSSRPDTRKIENEERNIKWLVRENKLNPTTEKLQARIANSTLLPSYGRNQDRFMEMAARFLGEKGYFGVDAQFRMYQFYDTDEQNEDLERLKAELPKREYDKLKFHDGRLVHFDTFANHLKRYPEWDTPFVISDNSIQVKIIGLDGVAFTVVVQRAAMVYLLTHALQQGNMVDAGKRILYGYFMEQRKEQQQGLELLQATTSILPEKKTELKKLLPKRLLHHYSPAVVSGQQKESTRAMLLTDAVAREERYQRLLQEATANNRREEFVKRNKGKQHKLQLVRKAWNLMYLRDAYRQQVEASGEHHKRYHITKEEYNDFCRYMFAFDEVPQYKPLLMDMLSQKGFLENEELREMLERASSLSDLFEMTIERYRHWLKDNDTEQDRSERYSLEGYNSGEDNRKMIGGELLYLNLSHFIAFLTQKDIVKKDENGKIIFDMLANRVYLIDAYYYKDKLEDAERKTYKKLFNQLNTARLEDTLLYEIAMQYLHADPTIHQQARTSVEDILAQKVVFHVKEKNGKLLYQLEVPFKQLDRYAELLYHKMEQEEDPKSKGTSFLSNIVGYIQKVRNEKDIKDIAEHLYRGKFTLDDLHKVDQHIIRSSVTFTNLHLALEEYFTIKESRVIKKDNRIDFTEIESLKKYYSSMVRNKAFHFGVPQDSYSRTTLDIEAKFIANEVKPLHAESYRLLPRSVRDVCDVLLKVNHNSYFNPRERDGKKRRSEAEQQFFAEVVQNTQPSKRSISLRR